MACYLDIYGKTLDVDVLEGKIRLGKISKFYKNPDAKGFNKEYANLHKLIRGTCYQRISEQSEVVIQFLKRHKSKLMYLVNHPDVEVTMLNFGVESAKKHGKILHSQCIYPTNLLTYVQNYILR